MSNLSPAARLIWSDYLERVRMALAGLSASEQDDVINELENHLVEETGMDQEPVSESKVQAVMARLGTAEDIADGYGITIGPTASPGPESYLLIVSSLAALCVGLVFPVLEIITIPVAAIASRIAISASPVRESPYRFAAYPGLIVGYLALCAVLLAWPLAFVMPVAATGGFLPRLLLETGIPLIVGSAEYWLLVWAAFLVVTALWWVALARIVTNSNLATEKVFFPFLSIQRKTVRKFLNAGAVALVATAIALGMIA